MNRRKFIKSSILSILAVCAKFLSAKAQSLEQNVLIRAQSIGDPIFLPLVAREGQEKYLTAWKSALDASQSSVANVLFVGDSITYGINIPDAQANGFAGLIRTELQSTYGDTGIGLVPVFNINQTIHWVTGGTGAWERSTYGIMRGCLKGNGANETLTIRAVCDAFDFQYVKNSSTANFTFSVDGSLPQNIGGAAALNQYITHIECGSLGEHTLVITSPMNGDCYIDAVYATRGDTGVRVHNAGRDGGTVSSAFANAATFGYVDLIQPDLSVICLTVNDYNGQTALATYQATLNAIAEKCKSYGSVLVVAGNPINASRAIPQTEYNAVAQVVAGLNGAAFLDMYARWGSYSTAVAAGYMSSSDPLHPTLAGQADYQKAILEIIL